MRTRAGRDFDLLVWIPGFVLSLFCATGLATHLGWIPGPIGLSDRPAVRTAQPPHKPNRPAVPAAKPVSDDRLTALIAWHVCVRGGNRCG
jgi:hypothetical protein